MTTNEKQWNTIQYPTAIDQSAASIRVKLMIIVVPLCAGEVLIARYLPLPWPLIRGGIICPTVRMGSVNGCVSLPLPWPLVRGGIKCPTVCGWFGISLPLHWRLDYGIRCPTLCKGSRHGCVSLPLPWPLIRGGIRIRCPTLCKGSANVCCVFLPLPWPLSSVADVCLNGSHRGLSRFLHDHFFNPSFLSTEKYIYYSQLSTSTKVTAITATSFKTSAESLSICFAIYTDIPWNMSTCVHLPLLNAIS